MITPSPSLSDESRQEKDVIESLKDQFYSSILRGRACFQQNLPGGYRPLFYNPATGTRFVGFNAFMMATLYPAHITGPLHNVAFLTMEQIKERGGRLEHNFVSSFPIIVRREVSEGEQNLRAATLSRVFAYNETRNLPKLVKSEDQPEKKYLTYSTTDHDKVLGNVEKVLGKHGVELDYSFKLRRSLREYEEELFALTEKVADKSTLHIDIDGHFRSAPQVVAAAKTLRTDMAFYFNAVVTGVGTTYIVRQRKQERGTDKDPIKALQEKLPPVVARNLLLSLTNDAWRVHMEMTRGLSKELDIEPVVFPPREQEKKRDVPSGERVPPDNLVMVYAAPEHSEPKKGLSLGLTPDGKNMIFAVENRNFLLKYPVSRLNRVPQWGECVSLSYSSDTQTYQVRGESRTQEGIRDRTETKVKSRGHDTPSLPSL